MKKYTIRHDKNELANGMLGDGKLALGFTLGAVSALLVYLVPELWTNAPTGRSAIVEHAPVIISLLVAMVSTFLATNALLEQRKAREAGTDPVLVAHLSQREDARGLVTLNISNIGAGAALNVLLNVEKPHEDLAIRNLVTDVFCKHHPFTVILQNKSIEFSLAMGWHLLGENPLPPFQATLSYEDLAGGKYESEFTIDVREMSHLGAHQSPQMRIVDALERIARK